MSTKEKVEQILRASMAIDKIEVIDDSHLHAHHAGAIESGGGHFRVLIVSKDFIGKNHVARHRMVYNPLEKELKSSIHALSLTTLAPDEEMS